MTLILSIVALLAGPLLYAAASRVPAAQRAINLFIAAAVAFIIVIHIIPEAWQRAGMAAVAVLVTGALFPLALERLFRNAHDTAHLAIVIIAAMGLLLHAAIDGIALLPATGGTLAWAVILHRVPVGIAIWWIVRPNLGMNTAIFILVAVVAATCVGYFFGSTVFPLAESRAIALLQAFVAGSMAHVAMFGVAHRH